MYRLTTQKVRLLLYSNPLLGLYHLCRKRIICRKNKALAAPSKIDGSFLLRDFDVALFVKYFDKNKDQKAALLKIADDFCEGQVHIYQRDVRLADFSVCKFHENMCSGDLYRRDVRFSWEIYRCKFVFLAGLSYWITDDDRYCEAITRFLERWKEFSPITRSDVPYNAMEAALKLINLSWCDVFLRNSDHYIKDIRKILIYALIAHAEYIYRNYEISIYGLESNHSLSCSVGLVYASILFPDYERSPKWRRFGMRTLKRALKKQFSKDGINFESSVHYHRFTFELLIFLLGVFYANHIECKPLIEESIRKIGRALKFLTHSNGYIARFGDNDGGKFLYDIGTLEEFNSLKYLQWFYGDTPVNGLESLLFSCIPQLKGFLKGEKTGSRVDGYIGYKGDDFSLLVTANEIGTNGKGNHQHNDFLSFELYTKRSPFIVDRWSLCYTGDSEKRNQDRSSSYHNNIQIDGREIVPFNERRLFEMLGDIRVGVNHLSENADKWTVDIRHDGYKNLKTGRQIHRRIFEVLKNQNVIKIKDMLTGKGSHSATLSLLIPEKGWSLHQDGNRLYFRNDYESFLIESSMGVFQVSSDFVSDNFLNPAPAYFCTVSTNYRDNFDAELTIKFENI